MYIFDISIFGIQIAPTWYGLMYALGFTFCYFFVGKYGKIQKKHMDTLLLYIFIGVIGGGRLGYVALYNPIYFWENPLEILALWNGGMSFHGGFLGVLLMSYIFATVYQYRFFKITDILAVCLPIALGLGRFGNWINNELPGYSPYNGLFSMKIGGIGHFPNPLLEMLLEGVVLFIILFSLWFLHKNGKIKIYTGILSAIFLLGYSTARLIAEQFRLPDEHIGYLFGTQWITLGILYTLPLFIAGIIIFFLGIRKKLG